MFNEAITKNSILSFQSWTTDRTTTNTGEELQLDIGSASNTNSHYFYWQQTRKHNE